ncbi:hypothetical protein KP509_28G036900 [Ceratopteris richardii]|uniref:Uncharacterized protein n=1 Tax=Ceratopteris richardii TaxID=49495 RepID=A0A8T2RDF7_CERRI|nr:hypothetical protein KP509_28G036900 [Ceratopteris richardii]
MYRWYGIFKQACTDGMEGRSPSTCVRYVWIILDGQSRCNLYAAAGAVRKRKLGRAIERHKTEYVMAYLRPLQVQLRISCSADGFDALKAELLEEKTNEVKIKISNVATRTYWHKPSISAETSTKYVVNKLTICTSHPFLQKHQQNTL